MIQDFAHYLNNVRGYAENTIRSYVKDLKSFATWATEHRPDARWSNITRDDIDAYMADMTGKGLKSTTINRHLSSISSMYKWLQRNGYDIENPCKYESRKKVPATIPTIIPAAKIAKAYSKAKGCRKLMLGLLASTGIRLQEMLDLTWADIDFDNSTLHIKGKGSKERIVTTDPEVLKQLHDVRQYADMNKRLFYISQRTARYMIYETLSPYCQPYHLNPHSIRHTFATELAKNGNNCTTIAKILGHAHLETSQKYINMAEMSIAHKSNLLTLN